MVEAVATNQTILVIGGSIAGLAAAIEVAYDNGAGMVVTPCPLCQMKTEVYREQISAKFPLAALPCAP